MSRTQANGSNVPPARRPPRTAARPPRPTRRQQQQQPADRWNRAVLFAAFVLAYFAAGVLVAAALPGLYGAANASGTPPPLPAPVPPTAEANSTVTSPAAEAAADSAPQSRPKVRRSLLLRLTEMKEQLAEFQPLETCDAPIYCKPAAGANWYAGDEQVVVQWNKAQANLLTTSSVDLALYERRKDNPSKLSDHTLIYREKSVSVARGFKFINVDNATIFSKWAEPAKVTGSTAVTRIHFWVITASFAPQTTNEEPGPDFFISCEIQFADARTLGLERCGLSDLVYRRGPPVVAPTTPTATARPTNNITTSSTVTTTSAVHTGTAAEATNDSAEETLSKPGGIALLSVGGFAMLCVLAGLVYWWRRRAGSRDTFSPREDTAHSSASTVADSVTEDGHGPAKNEGGGSAASGQRAEAAPERKDGPITSSDAHMLALAFHRLLRKPSWMDLSDDSAASLKAPPADAEEAEERLKVEEEFRRRTRELVRRQLDEEGTGIKTVSVHSRGEAGRLSEGRTPPGGTSDDEASAGEGGGKTPGSKRTSGDRHAAEPAAPVQPRSATMSGEISSPALGSPTVFTLGKSRKSAG